MADISLERTLPSNIEAERSILGAILLHAPALHDCGRITDADFYMEAHRRIFRAITALASKEILPDLITLKNELQRSNSLESVGGAAYLASLTDGLPRAINVVYYVDIVKEAALKRKLIAISNEAVSRLYKDEDDFKEIANDVQMSLLKLQSSSEKSKGWIPASELIQEAYKEIEIINSRSGELIGLDTGFKDLNKMLQGFRNSDLIILASRPGHGKTSLAMNITSNITIKSKKRVGVFTMEMSGLQIMKRALFAEAMVDSYRAGTGFLTKDDWKRLTTKAGILADTFLHVEESAGLTVAEVRAKAQALKVEHGLDFLVVDYLQLMSGSKEAKKQGRVQELSEISRGLKNLAKDLNIPVLAISQLSRKIEEDGKRKPGLSDLRESGSIEQDADIVLFIWREELRNPSEDNTGLAELIIGKQRNGPTGSISLAFQAQFTRFLDLYEEDSANQSKFSEM